MVTLKSLTEEELATLNIAVPDSNTREGRDSSKDVASKESTMGTEDDPNNSDGVEVSEDMHSEDGSKKFVNVTSSKRRVSTRLSTLDSAAKRSVSKPNASKRLPSKRLALKSNDEVSDYTIF